MSDTKGSQSAQVLKDIQLEAAKLDVELKRFELQNKPTFWKGVLTNPVVLGAIVTAFIALNSALVSAFATYTSDEAVRYQTLQQLMIDDRKFQSDLVLEVIKDTSLEQAEAKLSFLAAVGFLPDFQDRIEHYLQSLHPEPDPGE